jgi:hypothetical protein
MAAPIQLDKYARDARAWEQAAWFSHAAPVQLFTCDNKIVTCIPAATLAHHALEMFLEGALIVEGMTVFNPKQLNRLDPAVGLTESDCIWGHQLVGHARLLSARRPEFDLNDASRILFHFPHEAPMSLERGFAVFDPFFFELRYPGEFVEVDSVGPDDVLMFQCLVDAP